LASEKRHIVTVESGRQSRYMPREQGKTMEKFTTLTGIAAHLPMINVDTDMIIPKQYLKTIARTGLGEGLFAELRYDEAGERLPDFVLHNHPYTEAQILIAGDNFGCGSSREHAPWALLDFGFRCIVAPSFADIFYNNCFKNGILPIVLPQSEIDKLIDDASRGANAVMTVDLEAQEIRGPDGGSIPFDVDPHRKRCLMEGLDDIALTIEKADAIEAFEQETGTSRPWA
jgi:3-isopropylmalate/(R)-2-methylmalate dehydratase small subunit